MDQRGDALPLVESVFGGLLRSDVTCRWVGGGKCIWGIQLRLQAALSTTNKQLAPKPCR